MQYENNLRKNVFYREKKKDLVFKKPFPKGISGKSKYTRLQPADRGGAAPGAGLHVTMLLIG